MKNLIAAAFITICSIVQAQAPEFEDLQILYADGNYEKLVKVSDGYTNKESLAKDPLPFLWLAQGLYKISLSGSSSEKFKNAYKDAIAAFSKSLKNDQALVKKEGTSVLEDHQEFINEFQFSLAEIIRNDVEAKDFGKASGWIIKYYKITSNPVCIKHLDGAAKYKKADKTGANTLWKEADLLLSKVTSISEWNEAEKELLKQGILQTAECQIHAKQVEKAKATLEKVAEWYKDDLDFKTKYEELTK
jgi:hypothetical protein